MNKPVFPQPKCAAEPNAEAQPHRQRPRAKWAGGGLHEALSQLIAARALTSENSEPTGNLG